MAKLSSATLNVTTGNANLEANDGQSFATPSGPSGFEDEYEGLMDQVDKDPDQREEEDIPDWMFNKGKTSSSDPGYTLCSTAHRKQQLHLFTKHFCQHPLSRRNPGYHYHGDVPILLPTASP